MSNPEAAPRRDPLIEGRTREPTSHERNDVQEYTREVGKDLIYDIFKIDLDLLEMTWKTKFERFSRFDSKTAGVGKGTSANRPVSDGGLSAPPKGDEPLDYKVRIHVRQTDDIMIMRDDLENIPFAVKIDASSRFIEDLPDFKTEIYIPLSGKNEFWIRTSMPIPGISDPEDGAAGWRAYTNYSNWVGLSTLESGVGRQLMTHWNFSYGYRVRFKDTHEDERRHSWSMGRSF